MLQRIQSRKGQSRFDDSARALRNRMSYYRKHIKASSEYLQAHCRSRKINGVGSEAEVFRRLVATIEELRKEPSRV
jgi:adenylate kinase family enzyme